VAVGECCPIIRRSRLKAEDLIVVLDICKFSFLFYFIVYFSFSVSTRSPRLTSLPLAIRDEMRPPENPRDIHTRLLFLPSTGLVSGNRGPLPNKKSHPTPCTNLLALKSVARPVVSARFPRFRYLSFYLFTCTHRRHPIVATNLLLYPPSLLQKKKIEEGIKYPFFQSRF
jgi:hypothetical protein